MQLAQEHSVVGERSFDQRRRWRLGAGIVLMLAALAAFAVRCLVPGSSERERSAQDSPAIEAKVDLTDSRLRSQRTLRAASPAPARPDEQTVFGVVRSIDQTPIPSASVCLANADHAAAAISACGRTDVRGRFELPRNPTDSHVFASAPGYSGQSRVVASGTLTAPLVFELAPSGSSVSGLVLDAGGGPIPDAIITAHSDAAEASVTRSDASGRFALGVPQGYVRLHARAEAYSSAFAHVAAPAGDVTFALMPAAIIAGRVIAQATNEPLGGIAVTASSDERHATGQASTRSASDGAFRLEGLAAGTYHLVAASDGWRSAPQLVALGVGESASAVVIAVNPATMLSGTVFVDGLACPKGSVLASGPDTASADVGGDGAVRLPALRAGEYDLTVECDGAAPLTERLALALTPTVRRWALSAGLRVRGSVQDERGRPVGGAQVEVTPVEGTLANLGSRCTSDTSGAFSCGGLSKGEYESRVIAYGQVHSSPVRAAVDGRTEPVVKLTIAARATIRVRVEGSAGPDAAVPVVVKGDDPLPVRGTRDGREYVFQSLRLGRYSAYVESATGEPATTPSEVVLDRAEQVATVSLQLPPASAIAGRVVDERGAPLVDAFVQASASNTLSLLDPSPPVTTDDSGRFVIPGLMPGSYTVRVRAHGAEALLPDVRSGTQQAIVRVVFAPN